jgi:hypothetical protein
VARSDETLLQNHAGPFYTPSEGTGEMAMKILVVEDEQKAAAYLRKGLTENGFSVSGFASVPGPETSYAIRPQGRYVPRCT